MHLPEHPCPNQNTGHAPIASAAYKNTVGLGFRNQGDSGEQRQLYLAGLARLPWLEPDG